MVLIEAPKILQNLIVEYNSFLKVWIYELSYGEWHFSAFLKHPNFAEF